MGWENRRGRRYYYAKHWRAGTCQSEYLAGHLGAATAEIIKLRQARAAFERDQWRALVESERALDRQVNEALAEIRLLRDLVLYASGYHKHKGQWRKKRN